MPMSPARQLFSLRRIIGAIGGTSGARVCEFKMTMSEGHLLAPEDVSAEQIAANFDSILSPIPDITHNAFLDAPVVSRENQES